MPGRGDHAGRRNHRAIGYGSFGRVGAVTVGAATAGPPRALPEPLKVAWRRLAAPTNDPTPFTPDLLDDLPEPARRWLAHSIAPGTPLRRAAVLHQR